jgi:hypothetical protein
MRGVKWKRMKTSRNSPQDDTNDLSSLQIVIRIKTGEVNLDDSTLA